MKKLLIILLLLGLLFIQACEHVRIGVGAGREDKVAPQHQQQRTGQLAELELHPYRMIVSANAMSCDKCRKEITLVNLYSIKALFHSKEFSYSLGLIEGLFNPFRSHWELIQACTGCVEDGVGNDCTDRDDWRFAATLRRQRIVFDQNGFNLRHP